MLNMISVLAFFIVIFILSLFIDEKVSNRNGIFEQFCGDFWLKLSGNTETDLQGNVD